MQDTILKKASWEHWNKS